MNAPRLKPVSTSPMAVVPARYNEREKIRVMGGGRAIQRTHADLEERLGAAENGRRLIHKNAEGAWAPADARGGQRVLPARSLMSACHTTQERDRMQNW